jgi:Tol biopolymer transport system component
MTSHHTSGRLRTPAVAAGLALATSAALAGTTVLGSTPAYAAGPHNEQVVLVNGTNAEADAKSMISGTGQVSSADGRFVVFSTAAPLVPQDTNDVDDVYLRDTTDGITVLVSRTGKAVGNDSSFEPTISKSGQYVAFTTFATNLVKDANAGVLDVVVKDLYSGRISKVSVDSTGHQRKQNSFSPVISGNGKRVSFQTFARFGARDGDKREDVYVRDVAHHWTRQVSLTPKGRDVADSVLNGDISDNGNLVVFGENNSLWVRNVAKSRTTRFWHEPDAPPCQPFPAGSAGRPVISGDGRYVAFSSCATKLPGPADHGQVYRMKLADRSITLVSKTGHGAGDADSYLPSLSTTGRYVGFGSDATDLAADTGVDPDAFVADVRTGTVTRASQSDGGEESNSWSASTAAAISGDGPTLVYESYATNLVAGDAFDW